MNPLDGLVGAVTGASSGIGRAVAVELARCGVSVVLLARRLDALEETASRVRDLGVRAVVEPCDVGDRDAVRVAFDRGAAALGPIGLVVANAGISRPVDADRFDATRVAEVFRVNVLGAVYAVEAALPGMLARGDGRIVGVSSLASLRGLPGMGPYGATKAALNTFLEGLRVEVASRGIRVTTIRAGFVRTELTSRNRFPMPFLLEADEAARRIVRAIAAGKRVYDFPWQSALMMKILVHVPGFLYDRMGRRVSRPR